MVFETVLKNQLQVHATSILKASIENPEEYDYELDLSTLIASYNLRSEEEKADQEAINLAQKILFAGTIHHTANALETLEYLTIEDAQLQADFTYHCAPSLDELGHGVGDPRGRGNDLMHQYKPAPNQISLRFVREDGTDNDDKFTDHINTFLRRRKILLQKEDTTYQHDISEFDVGPQWHDHLRHMLLLPRLWCDFSTLMLFSLNEAIAIEPGPVPVPKEGPWTIYDNDNPEQVIPWTDVQKILQAGAKFPIQYALKVIDTNEDGPYPFEFDGGPMQVRSNIAIATASTVSTAIRDTIMADEPDNTRPQPMESLALDDKPQYKLFGDSKSTSSLAWHLGVDVSTPTGIDTFIRKVIGTLRVANVTPKTALNLAGLPGNVREEIQAGLAAATETTLNADVGGVQEDSNFEDYYKTQKLFAENESHTGPPLDACLEISQAVFDSWHDQNQILAKYKLNSLPTVKMRPLGHQITGFLWMIVKAYGYICAPTEEAQAIAEDLLTTRTLF
ncbi:hypothetical protein GMDG_07587 [Pseudogymnoascus destructans 20631-21]|uniref:Uncharacterized protein n=1 Tax=Pseudogymnoascus destructans (strain ATCC MYA-4855 / 20631-21) TaxID=658429 RepID=L8FYY0_PSED2|nr:hypothetical protein GMDG_07587 [Pseudogymnoascus destructans 20631-21]